MRVMVSGDIHIGRRSSRISGVSSGLRARDAWSRIVEYAIAEQVDVLLLSGDVADRDNRYWEAIGPLENGVSKLAAAGIETVAVSGNHDFDVLVRLSREFSKDQFRLLGKGGVWERHTVYRDGDPVFHIDGWSFPAEHVTFSPLDSYQFDADGILPTVGLVHGDLGQPTSRYAPLDRHSLEVSGADAWILGHIHAKRLEHAGERPWILYPGSPQALDPGETGAHGVWIFELTNAEISKPRFKPLSTVWYGNCDVDLTDLTERTDVESAVLAAIRSETRRVMDEMGRQLSCVCLRLILIGQSKLAGDVTAIVDSMESDLDLDVDGVAVQVEKVDSNVTACIDLEELRKSGSALGIAAQLLCELDSDSSAVARDLVVTATEALRGIDRRNCYRGIDSEPLSPRDTVVLLRQQLSRLINELVGQTQ